MAAEEEIIKGPKREEMHEPKVEKARSPSLLPKIFWWWSAPFAEERACSLL